MCNCKWDTDLGGTGGPGKEVTVAGNSGFLDDKEVKECSLCLRVKLTLPFEVVVDFSFRLGVDLDVLMKPSASELLVFLCTPTKVGSFQKLKAFFILKLNFKFVYLNCFSLSFIRLPLKVWAELLTHSQINTMMTELANDYLKVGNFYKCKTVPCTGRQIEKAFLDSSGSSFAALEPLLSLRNTISRETSVAY